MKKKESLFSFIIFKLYPLLPALGIIDLIVPFLVLYFSTRGIKGEDASWFLRKKGGCQMEESPASKMQFLRNLNYLLLEGRGVDLGKVIRVFSLLDSIAIVIDHVN